MKHIPIITFIFLTQIISATVFLDEQFDSLPDYFDIEYEIDGSGDVFLLDLYDSQPWYFRTTHIDEDDYYESYGDGVYSTYDSEGMPETVPVGVKPSIETSLSNGVLNILADGSSEDAHVLIDQEQIAGNISSTEVIYITVEAGNSAVVTDGGTTTNEDGELVAVNQAVVWVGFQGLQPPVEIALENKNGRKRIINRYVDTDGDGHVDNEVSVEVDNFDKVYLRISCNPITLTWNQSYSTDGNSFTELVSGVFDNSSGDLLDRLSFVSGADSSNVAFNEGEVYFDNLWVSSSPAYEPESVSNLQIDSSNGLLNVIGGSGPGVKEVSLNYPVDSSMTETGEVHFTVLANNSASVPDGGTFVDGGGDIEPVNAVVCGIEFGSTSIMLSNASGVKSINYWDPNANGQDGFLNVSNLEDIYLRISYDFNTSTAKSSYSTNGVNFAELSGIVTSYISPYLELEVDANNIELQDGDVYFDDFEISDDGLRRFLYPNTGFSPFVNEQFDSLPNYLEYDFELDDGEYQILSEQFDNNLEDFDINYENEGGTTSRLEPSVHNGVLNILTDGSSEDIEVEIVYDWRVTSDTGIIYATVEAGNTAFVADGGYSIDEDGELEATNQAVAWLGFNNYSNQADEIALQNHNGVKNITYGIDDSIDVSDFDKVFLRLYLQNLHLQKKNYQFLE